jgi:16S rRNA (cytosine1402-N4)-methyltransferase
VEIQHESVMPREILEYLEPNRRDGIFIDCTLGEGGHSARILSNFLHIRLAAIDADEKIMAKAKQRLREHADRTQFYNMYFDEFFADYPLEEPAHRILFDLGISVFHYAESGRGFSFLKDEALDMRLDPHRGRPLSAVLDDIAERELMQVLFDFGEERYARRIAAAIIAARGEGTIESSLRLAQIVEKAVPAQYRRGRIHAATRTFQALRILVNGELDRIRPSLEGAFAHLEVGGRIGVISFHSLEDRIVKHLFREYAKSCICPPELPMCECGGKPLGKLPVRKALQPAEDEVNQNPPSRSAKFRVIEKLRDSRHTA